MEVGISGAAEGGLVVAEEEGGMWGGSGFLLAQTGTARRTMPWALFPFQ